MDNPIYVGNGILEQIKNFSYSYPNTVTKESVFNTWMNNFKEFYKEHPYAAKWNYEGFIREILNYNKIENENIRSNSSQGCRT